MKLYKILIDGKSCHGGSTVWSLPQGDKPGEWHSVEGPLELCQNGFHLTDRITVWFRPDAKAFLVEAEEIIGDVSASNRKVAARRVRLLREATVAEYAEGGVFFEGVYAVQEGQFFAFDSASVTASGSASVTAYGSASVTAYGSASVTAFDSASVTAFDSASVTASGSASVTAKDDVTVVSWKGKDGVKLEKRAVLICRTYSGTAPEVFTAEGALTAAKKVIEVAE